MFDALKAIIRAYVVRALAGIVAQEIVNGGLTAEDLAVIDGELGLVA